MPTATTFASPAASNANVRIELQILSELDRTAFSDICTGLIDEDDFPTIATNVNVVAAILTSIVKGLASPSAYLAPDDALSQRSRPVDGGLRGLAMNFVRFQFQLMGPTSSSSSAVAPPVTLVQIAQQCSDLVKKWVERKEVSPIMSTLFQYFLDCHAPTSKANTSIPGGYDPGEDDTKPTAKPSASDVESFQKLLYHTLDCICSNTQQSLEDLMDFEYLWSSTLKYDARTDTPLSTPDVVSEIKRVAEEPKAEPLENGGEPTMSLKQHQCPTCLKEFNFPNRKTAAASFSNHVRSCRAKKVSPNKKKRKSASMGIDSFVTSEFIRQVAKELAWAFSRTSNVTSSNTKDILRSPQDQTLERRQRIIIAAACVDLVTAAMMAPILSAPSSEKRRLGSGGMLNPRLSVVDEAAAGLSTILNAHAFTGGISFREQAKASLLQATSDLLSTVTNKHDPIQHKDIVVSAQQVASYVLPLVTPENHVGFSVKSSPASNLLSFISSHQLRQRNLRVVKENYHRKISGKVNVLLNTTPLAISKDQKALKVGWFISKLQRNFFIDSVDEFCHLSLPERKILAPFAQGSPPVDEHEVTSFGVKAIVFCKGQQVAQGTQSTRHAIHWQLCQPSHSRSSIRHAIQISRVKNPPTAEELKGLNEWREAISCLVSTTSSIKPSPWLMNHFSESSATSVSEGSVDQENIAELDWKTAVLPILKYFITIATKDCSEEAGTCFISDTGEYKVLEDDATPGAVLQLYYFALELIIRSPPNTTLVHSERFHSSLFSLCYFCLRKAKHPDGRCFLIQDIGHSPMVFHKLVETFIRVLTPSRGLALPSYLIRILRQLQEMLLGMIWMTDNDLRDTNESNFAGMVTALRKRPLTWRRTCPIEPNEENSPQENIVGYMLHKLFDVITQRVTTLCELLPVSSASTSKKTMHVFRTMLHHRTDIFFNRHPDQLMLCSLYFVVCTRSKFAPEADFQKISDAYMEMNRDFLGSEIPYAILHRIQNCSDHDDQFGDIIELYNEVFVPSVKQFWRSFKDDWKQAQASDPPDLGENHTFDSSLSQEEEDQDRNGTNEDESDLGRKMDDDEGVNEQTLKDEEDAGEMEESSVADDSEGEAKDPSIANETDTPFVKEAASIGGPSLREGRELVQDQGDRGAERGENERICSAENGDASRE